MASRSPDQKTALGSLARARRRWVALYEGSRYPGTATSVTELDIASGFDFDTLERTPKLSAEWFREAARQNAVV